MKLMKENVEMEMKKRVVRAMGLHPNTPVDILFRGAESDLDVIHNIQKLLNRADYLTKTYGMPGYSKEVKNDFQKIKKFISSIDVEKQASVISNEFHVAEEDAEHAVTSALIYGAYILLPGIMVQCNLARTQLTIKQVSMTHD